MTTSTENNEAATALGEMLIANHGLPARPADELNLVRRQALCRAVTALKSPENNNETVGALHEMLTAFYSTPPNRNRSAERDPVLTAARNRAWSVLLTHGRVTGHFIEAAHVGFGPEA